MKKRVSIMYFIKNHEITKVGNNFLYAFYTGMGSDEVPVNSRFNYLIDSKKPNMFIKGYFEVVKIFVMFQESNHIVKDYNAIIYVLSSISFEKMKERMIFKDDYSDFKNICFLQDGR